MKESKGDKKAYAMLQCRSFSSPQKTPLWLHHSSSSMEFLRMKESFAMNSTPHSRLDTLPF